MSINTCTHVCQTVVDRAALLELPQDVKHSRLDILPVRHKRRVELRGERADECWVNEGRVHNVRWGYFCQQVVHELPVVGGVEALQ